MDIFPISTDDHAWEKPDTFTSRVPVALRDDCLHLEIVDGEHWWVYAGRRVRKVGTGAAAMREDRGAIRFYEEAPAAVYDATARLETMDADGVAAEVLFPQAAGFGGGPFVSTEGPAELRIACIRAYNDYLIEEWTGVSPRFVSQCLLPMWDVQLAVAEAQRASALGHKAVVWTSAPQNYGFPISTTCTGIRCGQRFRSWPCRWRSTSGRPRVEYNRGTVSGRLRAWPWCRSRRSPPTSMPSPI